MAGNSIMRNIGFLVTSYTMMALGLVLALLKIGSVILCHPLTAFKKTRRDVPPACLLDPSLGTHEYVTANGIKFHYVTAGDKSKPLMLFVHGFPEFWFSWRHQMREFSKDYHVVAIDMRGYGETDHPPNKLDYTFEKLKQDIVELISALGHSTCTLVAHDWGGVICWRVVQNHAELIDKFIVINCPHAKVFAKHLSQSWGQLFKSWYIFMFQWPIIPETILSMNDFQVIQQMFTGNAGCKNKLMFPPEVVEAYTFTFSKPGAFTGPLNYYRCMFLQKREANTSIRKKIDVPVLIIWGDSDVALDCKMADSHSSVASNCTVKHIPSCSHWAQQDAPDVVNQHMREFLFPEED